MKATRTAHLAFALGVLLSGTAIAASSGIEPYQANVTESFRAPATLPAQSDGYPAAANASGRPQSPAAAHATQARNLTTRGNAFYRSRRYAEAIAAYTQAIGSDPGYLPAFMNRALAYEGQGPEGYPAARGDFDKVIALNPGHGLAYYFRALLDKKNGRAYLDDLNRAAQLGVGKARDLLNAQTIRPYAPPAPNPVTIDTSRGYQVCNLPSNLVASQAGVERTLDRNYQQACLAILPQSCRNWVVDKQPCASRACVVDPNLGHCPNGEPTMFIAKETTPFTKEDLARMNAQINAEAARRAHRIDPTGQGLNQAQINAMETQRQLMWNSTGGDMVYK